MTIQWVFSLGGINLDATEVPEEFNWGHSVEMVVHKYLSSTGQATKKINSMGAFSDPVSWKGILLFSGALAKHGALDKLCIAQNTITWLYGPYSYQVVIKKYSGKILNQQQIEYSIELEIISSVNGDSNTATTAASFETNTQAFADTTSGALNDLLSGINSYGQDPTAATGLLTQYTNFYSTLTSLRPLAGQPYSTLYNLFQTAQAVLGQLSSYSTGLQNSAVLEADLAALNASLIALQGFGLLTDSLAQLLGQGPQTNTIANFAGNLLTLASYKYPSVDLSLAVDTIAQANSLNSYIVDTPMTLTLPPIFQ